MNPTLRYVLLFALNCTVFGVLTASFGLSFWQFLCLLVVMLSGCAITAWHFVTWLPDRDAEEQVRRWE